MPITALLVLFGGANALMRPPQRRRRCALRAAEKSLDVDVGGARLHVYGGRVGLQWDIRFKKETAVAVDPAALEVKESPGKGRGVFAAAAIAEGTFLGSYEGEVLDGAQFEERYGENDVPDYVVRVDDDCFVDGKAAAGGADPTPALFNHDEAGANVVRYCATRRPPRVDFFAARTIAPGEELLFPYGAQYWRGREGFDLDKPFLDPDEARDEGAAKEWLKAKYREDPEAFQAFYVGAVIAFTVFLSQFVVRWYKYNVWLPAEPGDLGAALDAFS